MEYLLDTNICIYIIKKKPVEVFEKFNKLTIGDVGISSITLAELQFGIEKSNILLPQELSAIYHTEKSMIEFIYAPLLLTEKVIERTFSLFLNGGEFNVYFGKPITTFEFIANGYSKLLTDEFKDHFRQNDDSSKLKKNYF